MTDFKFKRVKSVRRAEKCRYEVTAGKRRLGEVYNLARMPGSWFAADPKKGYVVGVAKTRAAAAAYLVPRKGKPPVPFTSNGATTVVDDDNLTLMVVQPLMLFDGTMQTYLPSAKRDPNVRAERRLAAHKVLNDHATLLVDAGVTAKVGKDGFVKMSPVAIERLLARVAA